ncbi:MAG: ATP-binding protein, partial [Hyphomonadaceae bacterium]|nr:ATP-binding protein [Hyphomonadaceae bacterium]
EADMVSMVTESDAIFAHLERGDASVAGRHMALMDAAFADLMGSLLAAVNVVQVAEDEELNAQLRIASRIRLLELVILVLVAAAVVGVTLYGRRVGAMVRQAEEMRVRMVDNLRVANQDLESYADNVAHELRSPVNKMLLSAEVALSRSRTTKDYHEALTSVVEEGRSLSRLVSSLLFLARARSGGVMLDRVRLDLCAELERVLSYFEASAHEKHVALHAKCDAGIGMAADRELVQRALSIVIGNALEHTPAGGRIEVSARLSAGSVHVVVADTGEGIDVAEQERVFERFYRGRGQVEADSERLGLGLAIVRSIMDMHGGVAQLHSVKPGGTTVTLSFPA